MTTKVEFPVVDTNAANALFAQFDALEGAFKGKFGADIATKDSQVILELTMDDKYVEAFREALAIQEPLIITNPNAKVIIYKAIIEAFQGGGAPEVAEVPTEQPAQDQEEPAAVLPVATAVLDIPVKAPPTNKPNAPPLPEVTIETTRVPVQKKQPIAQVERPRQQPGFGAVMLRQQNARDQREKGGDTQVKIGGEGGQSK